jgi:hypothetical protein
MVAVLTEVAIAVDTVVGNRSMEIYLALHLLLITHLHKSSIK